MLIMSFVSNKYNKWNTGILFTIAFCSGQVRSIFKIFGIRLKCRFHTAHDFHLVPVKDLLVI